MESEYVDMEPGWSKKNVWNELKSQYQNKAVNLGKGIFNQCQTYVSNFKTYSDFINLEKMLFSVFALNYLKIESGWIQFW